MKNTGGRWRRLDHRGAVARALRRQDAVGASRHRRHRRWARRRPTSTRAGARAGACGCSTSWSRTTTSGEGTIEERDDRSPLLSSAVRKPLEKASAGAAGEIATSAAGAWWCRRRRTSGSRRSTRIFGLTTMRTSCRTAPAATATRRCSRSCSRTADHNPNGATVRFLIDSAPMPADAAAYDRIVLMFDGEDEDAVAARPRALDRGQGAGVRGGLLAAGRAGPLGQKA